MGAHCLELLLGVLVSLYGRAGPECFGYGESVLVEIDRYHGIALSAQRIDEECPDPACADDNDFLVTRGAASTHGMYGYRHWLHECHCVVRHPEVVDSKTGRRRHGDVLGEGPIALETNGDVVDA
jgi:hypothetical protein